MTIEPHKLYPGIHQDALTYKYYKLRVLASSGHFSGTENLVMKVMADSFDSDPDVYMSRTNPNPHDSRDAEWYCEREGSETCVLHNGEFSLGDWIYIGVKCTTHCDYSLKAWYSQIIDLAD